MRILVAETLAPEGVALLAAEHQVDERFGLARDQLLRILPDYDALLVRSQVQVDAAAIAAGRRLVVIGRAGVGVDNVDIAAATRAGITVVNAPTGNTVAAAEHTMALLLAVARHVAEADASVRRGQWRRGELLGVELRGRTLGIVGLGRIGLAVADRARAFEMTMLGFDPFVTRETAAAHGVELTTFDDLIARSDAVTLHVPLSDQTRGLVGAEQLARMKPGAIVVNAARGGLVDEDALAAALHEGRLGGAGLDVFASEPPTGSPLIETPRVVLTPHLGASTAEAQALVAVEAAQQVLDVLAGRPARYAINAPLVAPDAAAALGPYLDLARLLGRFYAQLARGALARLDLELRGEAAEHDPAPLSAALLEGLLGGSTEERVNLINAPLLARARGIHLSERRVHDADARAEVLLAAGTAGGETAVGGSVVGGEPRLTRLGGYAMDMAPARYMLVTRHRDRPGTMGRIGQILGQSDVNISAMALGRSGPRADAFMVLALDDPVPEETASRIRSDPALLDLWAIELPIA